MERYSTYSTVQYSAVQYSTVQYSAYDVHWGGLYLQHRPCQERVQRGMDSYCREREAAGSTS